eukprot:PhF_6_TR40879/c0_g1_i1/m.61828
MTTLNYIIPIACPSTVIIYDPSTNPTTIIPGGSNITLSGHTDTVITTTYSPDGKRMATGSADNTARIWDAGTGTLIATLTGHYNAVTSVCFSCDCKRIATGSKDNTARIWDVENGTVITTLTGHYKAVTSVCFSPDGKHIATG